MGLGAWGPGGLGAWVFEAALLYSTGFVFVYMSLFVLCALRCRVAHTTAQHAYGGQRATFRCGVCSRPFYMNQG